MFRLIKNIVFVCFIFLIGYVFGVKQVRFIEIISSSMEPTLKPGDRVIVVKKDTLKRFDIVIVEAPQGEREILTKRVIGLPLEKIEIKDGGVFVNGEKLNEPYIKEKPVYILEAEIPADSYFLLGDNRNESEDSSVWGPVHDSYIKGKVVFRYWPIKDISIFSGISLSSE